MGLALARACMEEFADATGVSGKGKPRRYLWTDAFAVCNFLGLARQTGETRYLQSARDLVNQVHHILGRHREDDSRIGWISGLPESEGERHPTLGGLRIGKPLNERGSYEPVDSNLEWDRDGQYFHYLTKWMHALHCMSQHTGELHYLRWAKELAAIAHNAFTRESSPGGPMGMAWKMSIDLTRPLVPAMGQHDPLDGLITCLELENDSGPLARRGVEEEQINLVEAISDLTWLCNSGRWTTDDPLGIGGLLDEATRLARLIFERGVPYRSLLLKLLTDAGVSMESFSRSRLLYCGAEHRLAFRELGFSIGMHGMRSIEGLLGRDAELAALGNRLLRRQFLAEEIEAFWCDPAHRLANSWREHGDINTVMLATSLAPEGYLQGGISSHTPQQLSVHFVS